MESKQLNEKLQAEYDDLEMIFKQENVELNRIKQENVELNRINQELIFTNQNLSSILQNMGYGIVTISRSGDFQIINANFGPKSDMWLADFKTKLKDLFIRRKFPFINSMVDDNEPFTDQEIKLFTIDGPMYLLASGTPVMNEEGIVSNGVVSLRPIKEVHGLVNRFSGFHATFHFEDIISNDHLMLDLIENARNTARNMSNVLIYGESGTGKELFAQSIHNESSRSKGPFLAINCGAIPRELIGSELFGYAEGAFTSAKKGGNLGKFELANGGTIFLDEIGDLPFEQQAALLRVIQEKTITRISGREVIRIDVRIICATNKDLLLEMNKGNFRHDLYYRLNVINFKITPLRERPSDVILLFKHFLKITEPQFGKKIETINDDVLNCLIKYHWPGNVRELQNVVERMLNNMLGSSLEMDHLPIELKENQEMKSFILSGTTKGCAETIMEAMSSNRRMMEESEKKEIIRLIGKHRGNISRMASEMGLSRPTLYKKMRNHSL